MGERIKRSFLFFIFSTKVTARGLIFVLIKIGWKGEFKMEMAVMLSFILGAAIGVAMSIVLDKIRCSNRDAYGSFKIRPVSDEDGDTGLYSVNVAIVPNQDLLNKKRIILVKDSHN